MKVSKLLAMSALLLSGSGVAEASLVDGVRQKPEPKTTAFDWNAELYMYNTGAKKYLLGANNYNTRGSVGDNGYKVKLTKHVEDGMDWDGYSAILSDSVETQKAWKMFWIGDAEGTCWVDNAGQADTIWTVKSTGNDIWRVSAGENNPTYNSISYPNTYLGVKADDEGNTPMLWTFLTDNDKVDWKFVSVEDYAAHQEALAVYAKAESLRALIEEAKALGVDYAAAKAVYENEASTMEQIEEAITALDAAIIAAKENMATVDNPSDMTSKVVNAGYDNATNDGWSGTSPAFGYGAAEFYNKTYDGYQKLTGLPAGVYAVKLSAFYRAGNYADGAAYRNWVNKTIYYDNARLYAVAGNDTVKTTLVSPFEGISPNNPLGVSGETSVTEGEYTYYLPNTMESAAEYFKAGYYGDNTLLVATTDGELTIGLKKDSLVGGDWTLFDNWQLTYYGNKPEAYALWMSNVLKNYEGAATPAEDAIYTYSVLEDYKAVLESVKNASDQASILAAIKQLDEAKATLQANIDAWAAYKAIVEKGKETAGRPDSELFGEDKEILGEYIEYDYVENVYYRTMTTEEVLAEIEKVEQLIDNAIQNGLVPHQKFDKLVNPDFEDGANGWQGNPTIGGSPNHCAEAYQKKFDVYQIVKGAPQGVYRIEVQAFFRDGLNDAAWPKYQAADGNVTSPVSVYLNSNATPIMNLYDEKVTDPDYFDPTANPAPFEAEDDNGNTYYFANDMKNASVMFADGRYKKSAFGLVAQKGDEMRIGIKGDASANGNWAIWDNFTLYYEGFDAEIIMPELETAATDLNAVYNDNTFGTELSEKVPGVLATAMDALDQTDGRVMFDALVEIIKLKEDITASEAVFTEISNILVSFEDAIVNSDNSALKAEANTLFDAMEAAISNGGTVTTEEASSLLARCKDLIIRLALPVGEASATNPLDYTALIQNPNFEKDGANSIESWNGTSGYNFGNDDTQKSALMVEFYDKTFDMYQDIALENVPNGNYKLQLSAFYRYGSTDDDYAKWTEDPQCGLAKIYAVSGDETFETPVALLASGAGAEKVGEGSEATINGNLYAPNDMVSANAYFTLDEPRYLNELVLKVTDGKLRVGIKKDTKVGSDWVIMDSWKLFYYGTSEVPDGIENVNAAGGAPVKVEYYNVNGMKLNKPVKGLVIVRSTDAAGNKTVKTVVVK